MCHRIFFVFVSNCPAYQWLCLDFSNEKSIMMLEWTKASLCIVFAAPQVVKKMQGAVAKIMAKQLDEDEEVSSLAALMAAWRGPTAAVWTKELQERGGCVTAELEERRMCWTPELGVSDCWTSEVLIWMKWTSLQSNYDPLVIWVECLFYWILQRMFFILFVFIYKISWLINSSIVMYWKQGTLLKLLWCYANLFN